VEGQQAEDRQVEGQQAAPATNPTRAIVWHRPRPRRRPGQVIRGYTLVVEAGEGDGVGVLFLWTAREPYEPSLKPSEACLEPTFQCIIRSNPSLGLARISSSQLGSAGFHSCMNEVVKTTCSLRTIIVVSTHYIDRIADIPNLVCSFIKCPAHF
jgi:hypothetical protein